MGNDLQYIGMDKKLMNRTLIGKGLVPRINRCNYLKLRHFNTANEIIPTEKTVHIMGENMYQFCFQTRGYYAELKRKTKKK